MSCRKRSPVPKTVKAHRQMQFENCRSCAPQQQKQIRTSDRHVHNLKKRKCSELNVTQLESTLTDLYRAKKLVTPTDVCEVLHGDDSPQQKKIRSAIYKILHDKFKIAKIRCMQNHYSAYRKWKNGTGPPVAEHFKQRRPPMMPVRLFKEKVTIKLLEKEHHQKDLRKITEEVLKTHLSSKHIGEGLSPIIKMKVSHVTVDKYINIAVTCKNVHNVTKKTTLHQGAGHGYSKFSRRVRM